MAIVTKIVCDLCGSEPSQAVVIAVDGVLPVQIDLCAKCVKSRLGDIIAKGHKPVRRESRKRVPFTKTEVPPEAL